MRYFVTAIGTDSGKTIFSAILTEFLKADYWKPIQAGEPRDREEVRRLISNSETQILDETFLLRTPVSPHASAQIDGVKIRLSDFQAPKTNRDLVIEGAGGMLVPINDTEYVIELAQILRAEVFLVCNLYLGSINHTLLSIDWLERNKIPVKGIVFNGSNPESERIIELKSPWPTLLRIKPESIISQEVIRNYADELTKTWN